MCRYLLAFALLFQLPTILLAIPDVARADDASAARVLYNDAQSLKRASRLDAARSSFQHAAESTGPEDAVWADLAREELRFGLPMHEARLLAAQLATAGDFPGRRQMLSRIDAIYRQLLADNSDRPERIAEIERLRDELALTRQSVGNAEQSSIDAMLNQLRQRVQRHYAVQRQWPDWPFLENELAEALRQAGLKDDRMYIVNFYPSREQFYATLRDTQSGRDTTIKGDNRGVTLVRE
jgi:hypothetical protein